MGLTPAQEAMMALVETGKVRVRRDYGWLVDGRAATGAQTRVLDRMHGDKLIVTRLTPVSILGLREPKRLWVAFKAGA